MSSNGVALGRQDRLHAERVNGNSEHQLETPVEDVIGSHNATVGLHTGNPSTMVSTLRRAAHPRTPWARDDGAIRDAFDALLAGLNGGVELAMLRASKVDFVANIPSVVT